VGPFAKLDILELNKPIAGKLPVQLAAVQLSVGLAAIATAVSA
jgi:hypothetical protein